MKSEWDRPKGPPRSSQENGDPEMDVPALRVFVIVRATLSGKYHMSFASDTRAPAVARFRPEPAIGSSAQAGLRVCFVPSAAAF